MTDRKPGQPFEWERAWPYRICRRCYDVARVEQVAAREIGTDPELIAPMTINPECPLCLGTGVEAPGDAPATDHRWEPCGEGVGQGAST